MDTKDGIDIVDNKKITVEENNKTQNIVLINHRLPKEEKEEEQQEEKEEQTTTIKEELPNTGNNKLLYSILSLSFSVIGFIYEKKNS